MGSSWYCSTEIPWLILLASRGHIQEFGVDVGDVDVCVSVAMMGSDADHVGFGLSHNQVLAK